MVDNTQDTAPRQRRLPVEAILVLAGGGLLWAGTRFSAAILTGLGIFAVALAMGRIGSEMLRTRRADFRMQNWGPGPVERYSGLAAQLYGVWFIGVGLGFAVLGVVAITSRGGMEGFWKAVASTPQGWGLVVIAIGLLVAVRGVIRILAGTAGVDYGLPGGVAGTLTRANGALVVLLAAAMVALGILLVLVPGVLRALADHIIRRIFQ